MAMLGTNSGVSVQLTILYHDKENANSFVLFKTLPKYSNLHQGLDEGGHVDTIHLVPNDYGGAESLRRVPSDCGVAEKSQQRHKYFFQ